MSTPILGASSVVSASYSVWYMPPGSGQTFLDLGSTTPEKGAIERIKKSEEVIQTNALGAGTTVDFIYTGQERFLEFDLQQYNLDSVQRLLYDYTQNQASQPVGHGPAERPFSLGPIGRLGSQFAGQIQLRPVFLNTPVRGSTGTTGLRTIQYHCAVCANEQELSLQMKAGLMVVNVMMRLLPMRIGTGTNADYSFGQYVNTPSS